MKHPDWSLEVCTHVSDQKILIGMTEEQVREAWGPPDNENTTTTAYGTHKQWVARDGSYLYFDDGVLKSIQQLH